MSDNHKVLITVPSVVSTRVSFLGGDAGIGSKHVGCCNSVENVKKIFRYVSRIASVRVNMCSGVVIKNYSPRFLITTHKQ